MKKSGFTFIELTIALVMMVALTGTVIFTFLACFRSWDAGEDRSKVRIEISQAMELMVRNLQKASSFDVGTSSVITFNADLGEGEGKYGFFVQAHPREKYYQLFKFLKDSDKNFSLMASFLESDEVFSNNGKVITINLTGVIENSEFYMRTSVRPRNL